MNAEVKTENSFANAIPEESVVDFEGKSYVFTETGKQTWKMVPVTLGISENGFVEILNFADFQGKKIVVKNAYTLLMKLKNTSEDEE
jgi:cobalt-zinc-cadmium efflux system membrane fusion protein